MYFKVRKLGENAGDDLIVNLSKMAKIEELCRVIKEKLDVDIDNQRLFYKGKQVGHCSYQFLYTSGYPDMRRLEFGSFPNNTSIGKPQQLG